MILSGWNLNNKYQKRYLTLPGLKNAEDKRERSPDNPRTKDAEDEREKPKAVVKDKEK